MRVQALGFRSYMVWKVRYEHLRDFSVIFHHFFQFSMIYGSTRWRRHGSYYTIGSVFDPDSEQ